jgi:hypothetical protein
MLCAGGGKTGPFLLLIATLEALAGSGSAFGFSSLAAVFPRSSTGSAACRSRTPFCFFDVFRFANVQADANVLTVCDFQHEYDGPTTEGCRRDGCQQGHRLGGSSACTPLHRCISLATHGCTKHGDLLTHLHAHADITHSWSGAWNRLRYGVPKYAGFQFPSRAFGIKCLFPRVIHTWLAVPPSHSLFRLQLGQQAAAMLQREGCNVTFVQLDINDSKSIRDFATAVKASYGGLDILVNNAAIAFKGRDPTPFAQQARPTIKTNFYGTLAVCDALTPLLRQGGRLVNVASMSGPLRQFPPRARPRVLAPDFSRRELCALVSSLFCTVCMRPCLL